MQNKPGYKKILAREILIFFSAVVLVLIMWVCALLRNGYYQYEININNDKIISLSKRLDTLPTDYNVLLYRLLKANYDTFENNYYIFESKLRSSSYIDSICRKYLPQPVDWNTVPDDTTSETSVNNVNTNNLKKINSHKKIPISDSNLINLLNFEFHRDRIKTGFGYNNEVRKERIEIPIKINGIQEKIRNYYGHLLDDSAMWNFVFLCTIVVVGIAYVLRLSVLILLWALKNIKA